MIKNREFLLTKYAVETVLQSMPRQNSASEYTLNQDNVPENIFTPYVDPNKSVNNSMSLPLAFSHFERWDQEQFKNNQQDQSEPSH